MCASRCGNELVAGAPVAGNQVRTKLGDVPRTAGVRCTGRINDADCLSPEDLQAAGLFSQIGCRDVPHVITARVCSWTSVCAGWHRHYVRVGPALGRADAIITPGSRNFEGMTCIW